MSDEMDLTALQEAQAEAEELRDEMAAMAARHKIEIKRLEEFAITFEEDNKLYRSALASEGVNPDDVTKLYRSHKETTS